MRRFLQGLGLGLLVAALVMGINTRDAESLSGDALVERAREIGMVFPAGSEKPAHFSDEDEDNGEASADSSTATGGAVGAGVGGEEGSTTMASAGDKAASSEKPDSTEAPEKTEAPKASATPKPTTKPRRTRRPRRSAPPSDINATPQPRETELPRGTVVELEVRSGLLSSSVARELYEAGVIDDMWEFDHYIEEHGLGHYLIAGTYELTVGDSYEHIANIITHRG